MVLAEYIVQIALAQVPIVDTCRDRQRTLYIRRYLELIPDKRRPARLNRVVIGHGVHRPHLVVVYETSSQIHWPIREAMSACIEHAVRFEEAAVVYHGPRCVLYCELRPCLVEITDLGNERVADILVLNDHVCIDNFSCL